MTTKRDSKLVAAGARLQAEVTAALQRYVDGLQRLLDRPDRDGAVARPEPQQ